MMTGTFNGDYVIIFNGAEMNDPEKNAKLATKAYGTAYEADAAKALKIGTADGRIYGSRRSNGNGREG